MYFTLPITLFAASASAQLTTSIWAFNGIGTEKVGFYGSVVNANSTHTTLVLVYDNGTDTTNYGTAAQTWTIGPTFWEQSTTHRYANHRTESDSQPDDEKYKLRCEVQTSTDAIPTCTASYGRVAGAAFQCQTGDGPERTVFFTRTHTYSGRGTYSAGVETIVQAFTVKPRSDTADWCDQDTFPATYTGTVTSGTFAHSDIGTYQVVITAGQEKLNATTGASATLSSAQPTGSQAQSGSAAATFTGAAAPMKTVGPAVVGLGAAMAAFVL